MEQTDSKQSEEEGLREDFEKTIEEEPVEIKEKKKNS